MTSPARRTEKLDLRLTPQAKRTLQAAAAAANRTVSEFVLESALQSAAERLPDRRLFGLEEPQWRAFQAALDRPHTAAPALEDLLRRPSAIERE